PGGWPEPFRSRVLAGRNPDVTVQELAAEDEAALDGDAATRRRTLNRLLFPQPASIHDDISELFGDLSVLDTLEYLYGLEPGEEHVVEFAPGVQLFIGLEAIGEPDDAGMRTVMATLNGQLRPVFVRDRSVAIDAVERERANPQDDGHVA